ncbi:sensor histidine kinase [Aliarcobacter cibarius]|uniref:sensor histidine kinase n=1 Tax=Aliarcobacter cibarius TaxID=255507 RepID=UPI001866DD91|nr:HAMP domain-containing sensor histidine kinase [Aliarcobacter cibarius]
MKNFVNSEVRLHKKAISNSIQNKNLEFQEGKELFYNISKDALELLKKDKNLNLSALKNVLKVKYDLKNYDFDLYLIDDSYTIYKTTYIKDLNLDLKNISDAKLLLEKSLDGNIYFSNFINSDPVSLEYRLYAYASIAQKNFLELSFINTQLSSTSMSFLVQNLQSNSNVKVYRVFKNKEGFSYYDMLRKLENINKEEYYKSLEIIKRGELAKNDIMNSGINFIQSEKLNNNILTITTPIFDKNMLEILGFDNVVIELEIDLSDRIEFMEGIKNLFIGSLFVIFFILLLVFTFIQNRFTRPIESILKSIKESKKVDKELINYNNELSRIATKYNILYDNFTNELVLNSNLLEENKRFIADTVHQIRTPLTNIMMNGEMIKKFQKDESMNVFIEQIDASINMLSNSYEDLAYLITSNSISYKPKNINLSQTIKDRIKFFATISKVNFKKIEAKIEDEIYVNMNEIELERIIDNNLSNAIKYGFKDKTIDVFLIKNKNEAILEFRTFSNKIKNRDMIFSKNYRENDAKRGLGLGLYMVSNICIKYDIKYEILYENEQNIFKYIFKI